jgi:hypothetical protein
VAELGEHAARDAGVEAELALGQGEEVGVEGFLDFEVGGDEMELPIVTGFDEGVGIAVDRGVQHGTAELVAIRAEIGASAGEPEAERNTGTYRIWPGPQRPLLIS